MQSGEGTAVEVKKVQHNSTYVPCDNVGLIHDLPGRPKGAGRHQTPAAAKRSHAEDEARCPHALTGAALQEAFPRSRRKAGAPLELVLERGL